MCVHGRFSNIQSHMLHYMYYRTNIFITDVEITTFVDEGNTVQAIYFQTGEMKSMFMSYPEVLFIDATYKLNDL